MRPSVPTFAVALLFVSALYATPQAVSGQAAADSAAVEEAALNYIQGYYSGSPERMEKALHPELAKRIVRTGADGKNSLDQMDAKTLVEITQRMSQRPVPEEDWVDDVIILDIYESVASVRIDAAQWIDYLHLAKWNGEWKIVNVLWEMHPGG